MTNKPKPPSTIRLSPDRKNRVLDDMDRNATESTVSRERRRIRVSYRHDTITVHIFNYEGQKSTYSVVPRNLSTQGLGFLHGIFCYPDNQIVVELETIGGKIERLTGRIRSCRLISGNIHEVGVAFDLPIDLTQFINMDADTRQKAQCEFNHETIPSTGEALELSLTGHALVVADSPPERKLLELWLTRLGLTVFSVTALAQAKEKIATGAFVLALVDAHLGDDSGVAAIKELRGMENPPPILAMSADENPAIAQPMLDAGAADFLVKPLDEETTLNTIAAIMGIHTGGGDPIPSALAGDQDMMPLIEEFVGSMSNHVADLQRQIEEADLKALGQLCHQLKGAGGSYGFEILSDAAKQVSDQLTENADDVDALRQQVDALIGIASRLVVS